MSVNAPTPAPDKTRSVETSKLIVRQPEKLAELGKLLETFDNLDARVGERSSSGPAGNWSGASGTGGSSGQGDDDGLSPREKAIQAMPSPEIVRQRLEQHIEKEVSKLERSARLLAKSGKPGAAFHLTVLYAKIRKLNSLLDKLVEFAEDVLKRLFIKVFIDKQTIL